MQELKRQGATETEWMARRKSDPVKLAQIAHAQEQGRLFSQAQHREVDAAFFQDVDQRQRLFQRLGQGLIGTARFGNAGRMVMREDHASSVYRYRLLHNFSRIDTGLSGSPAKKLFSLDKAILRIHP